MKNKKILIFISVFLVIALLLAVCIWHLRPVWKNWPPGDSLVCKEVIAIVWVRPQISGKISYKKFTDVREIKNIISQIALPKAGEYSLKDTDKNELRIYFLDGDIAHLYFAMDDGEFVGPRGRNKELFEILNLKEKTTPSWWDVPPEDIEEVERRCKSMKEVIKGKKASEKIGL